MNWFFTNNQAVEMTNTKTHHTLIQEFRQLALAPFAPQLGGVAQPQLAQPIEVTKSNLFSLLSVRMHRTLAKILSIASLLTLSLIANSALGQAGVTPDLIERFNQLSPAERAALLGGTQTPPGTVQAPVAQIETVTPRAAAPSANEDAIEDNAQQTQASDSLTEQSEGRTTTGQTLRQFGYNLFAGTPSTFAPATNIPVPLNYVMGPSDTVVLQFYGQINTRYEIAISREGVLQFPEVGPLNVAGLTFDEMRQLIQTTIDTTLIGQQVSVTMGALRSVQIFVLGEAFRPVSYTVSSLSTMTNALFSSGGVTNVGSLRSIRLMRNGEMVTELDLYDLLLRGDTSGDTRLLPNDVMFIPAIGRTVGIAGEVIRPAIFELKEEDTIEDILPLSGGFLPTSYIRASRVERINDLGERTLLDVDLSDPADLATVVSNGDILQIYSILDQVEGVVILEGHVNRPGGFAWQEGLRVTDILPSVTDMLPNPDLDFALISREVQPARTTEIINVNLREAIANPGSAANIEFQPRDRLLVFGARQSRQQQVQGLIDTLRAQATFDQLPLVVSIEGNVRFPGEYPLLNDMTMDDLVKFAGGLGESTALDYALVQRQIDLEGTIEVLPTTFNPQNLNTATPVPLQPLDTVLVFNSNGGREALLESTLARLRSQSDTDNPTQIVSIIGNVRFPGNYPLNNDLTVGELIDIAGGLSESAETRAAEITRYDAEPTVGREVGHISIDLGSNRDFSLQPFDQLIIRQMPNWTEAETVSIAGEVNSPGTYVITKEETIDSLIARAGGLTEFADPKAAVFLRESLRQTEARLLTEYRNQLETDIITLRLQQSVVSENTNNRGGSGESEAIQLLDRINTIEATGRLVIDLPQILSSTNTEDVILRDSDRLLIPRAQQEITITGEVFRPTSHLFEAGLTLSDFINRSGGLTDNADRESIYVAKSNGELVRYGNRGYWFFQSQRQIEPGDTIVVPFQAYKPYSIFIWTGISQILANLSTTLLLIDRITD